MLFFILYLWLIAQSDKVQNSQDYPWSLANFAYSWDYSYSLANFAQVAEFSATFFTFTSLCIT
jgi:hypothetical protein